MSGKTLRDVLEIIERRIDSIERRLNDVEKAIAEMRGQMNTTYLLVKWVIFPLITILAALIGIKIVLPA